MELNVEEECRKITKDTGLTLPKETQRAVFECLSQFPQELDTCPICAKGIDQIMSLFTL